MRLSSSSTSVLSLASILQTTLAVSPVVQLDYATYQGTTQSNGISSWLGMRFAAPPIGNLRFAAPQDPLPQVGIQPADARGKLCMPTDLDPPDAEQDEDCLFVDVFAPTNVTSESRLPVYVFTQGGGFNSLSNPKMNGTGLIEAGDRQIVVVTFNYRVGLYGFLASEEVQKDGTINAGLKDQRKVLQWVQKYISKFGGNPEHVVLGGDSAGAQSVCLQVTAYGGKDEGLFVGTAAESQSFPPLRTVEESQYAYDNLVIRTGCSSSPNATLDCLRGLSTADIQAVNINTPYPGAQVAPLYMYGPVLDYDFVSDLTLRAYSEGKFVQVPAIYGDATNEGTVFTPNSTASYGQSDTFVQSQFPLIRISQLAKIRELYPVEDTPSFPDTGRYWRQVSDVYGDLRYTCPGTYVSQALAEHNVTGWNYHWNVIDPKSNANGEGVTHTVELHAIWGPENSGGDAPVSYYSNGTNAAIVPVTQAYWASFIRSLDPNTYRLPGTPTWEEWTSTQSYQRLRFQTNSTAMENVPEQQREQCAYFSSIGLDLRQ